MIRLIVTAASLLGIALMLFSLDRWDPLAGFSDEAHQGEGDHPDDRL